MSASQPACPTATTGGAQHVASESPHAVDEYSIAARSWIGADIEEMLAAWPNPNMQCGSNTIGEVGVITRIEVRQSSDCHRLFKDHFDRMTRHAALNINATVEEL